MRKTDAAGVRRMNVRPGTTTLWRYTGKVWVPAPAEADAPRRTMLMQPTPGTKTRKS